MNASLFDYGQYRELFADKRTLEALSKIKSVAKRTKVRWYLVGGAAVYLLVKNPPQDYPDLDVLIDATKDKARALVSGLRRSGFEKILYDESDVDVFSAMTWKGIQLDLFTSREQPTGIRPIELGTILVEPAEHLIVEKLIRGTYEDLLMAMDLLCRVKIDKTILYDLAARHRLTGRIMVLLRLCLPYQQGRLVEVKKLLKRIATAM